MRHAPAPNIKFQRAGELCFRGSLDSFPLDSSLTCVRFGHGDEDPAQRADLQALEGPRRGIWLRKETMQWRGGLLGPAGLRSGGAQAFYLCQQRARIWFALCSLHIGEYKLDLTFSDQGRW